MEYIIKPLERADPCDCMVGFTFDEGDGWAMIHKSDNFDPKKPDDDDDCEFSWIEHFVPFNHCPICGAVIRHG